jgi:hypothetical protein
MSSALESSKARRQRREARSELAKQKQIEEAALAESESEVAERRARATSGRFGRRSLIAALRSI